MIGADKCTHSACFFPADVDHAVGLPVLHPSLGADPGEKFECARCLLFLTDFDDAFGGGARNDPVYA